MLHKCMRRALLVLLTGLTLAHGGFAETGAASLTPPAVTQNGVTAGKTAVLKDGCSTFDVTLTVAGGETLAPYTPVDVVFLLDCSAEMAQPLGTGTKIEAARAALAQLLNVYTDAHINARIGLIGYSGTAVQLIEMTPLYRDTSSGPAQDDAAIAALLYAIQAMWAPVTGPESGAGGPYGLSGGRNLDAAFAECAKMFAAQGGGAARYCIDITGGAPNVYGAQQMSSDPAVPPQRYMAQGDLLQATAQSAAQVRQTLACLFSVGLDTPAQTEFASPGAAACVSQATLESTLRQNAGRMFERVQNLTATDVLGNRFTYVENTLVSSMGTASVSSDGRAVRWDPGTALAAGQTARLSYTLRLNDPQLEGAGRVVPLNAAAQLSWDELADSGALVPRQLDFPAPTTLYEAGTLRVVSTGLPAGTEGTSQIIGSTRVGCGPFFTLTPPAAAPAGYVLQSISLDGISMSPEAFVEKYHGKIAVRAGETLVEYRYAPVEAPALWNYAVEYTVNSVPQPAWNYTAAVPADDPVVQAVKNYLPQLSAGYRESPVLALPLRLSAQGQVLHVAYAAPPSSGAPLTVNSSYYLNGQTLEGTRTETPALPLGQLAVRTLLNDTYDGKMYQPVSAVLTRTPLGRGEKPVREQLPLAAGFAYEDGYSYVLDAVFSRAEHAVPETSFTPVQPVGSLPKTGADHTVPKLLIGLLAAAGSVALHWRRRKA